MELWTRAEHGVVSRADIDALGYGPTAVRHLLRTGQVRSLIRGWYAVRPPEGCAPWDLADRDERARTMHALTSAALVRSFEGRVVASHYSALVLHGIGLWRSDLGTAHITRVDDVHSRHRRGAVIHPRRDITPVEALGGLLTVPLAQAIVETGLLGTTHPNPTVMAFESLVAADRALWGALVTDDEIAAELERHARTPGIIATRGMLQHREGRHESVGETRTAHLHRLLGIASTPQVEVVVRGRSYLIDRVDDEWPIATEFDGMVKYSKTLGDPSRTVVAEKRRESEIADATGMVFLRATWPDLDDPTAYAGRYEDARRRIKRRGTRAA